MIVVKSVSDKQSLRQLTVTGHANYGAKGEDIVCAAVSTAVIVTANAIEHLNLNHVIEVDVQEGYFKIIQKTDNASVTALINNLEYTLDELEKQYPKYIKKQKEG